MRKPFFQPRRKGGDQPMAVEPHHLYTYGDISEEVKDIVGRRPVWIVRFGSAIFLSIILSLVALAMCIEFPRKLANPLVINSVNPNVLIKAGAVGRVARLLVHDNEYVRENEIVGYLDSAAVYSTMLRLDSLLHLASSYAVYGPYSRLRPVMTSLQDITCPGCDHDIAAALTSFMLWYAAPMQIRGETHAALLNSLELCKTDVREWKKRFLLVAPVAGQVRYVDLKTEGQIVTRGEDLLYIAQPASPLYGDMRISQTDLSVYQKGQTVTVKIDGLSTIATGDISGIVEDILADPDKAGSFIVKIALPASAMADHRFPLCAGMNGQAYLSLKTENLLMTMLHRMLPGKEIFNPEE